MANAIAQGTVFHELSQMKKAMSSMQYELDSLKAVLSERLLSKDDKRALNQTLKAEKQGKLKSMKDVFG